MKKALGVVLVLGGLAAASLPLMNLMLDNPPPAARKQLDAITEPYFKAAAPVLQAKCVHCHAVGTAKPFYANVPIASILIEQDVHAGLSRLDFATKLTGEGEAFSEIELARIEKVLNDSSMPPLRYAALHWKSPLSQQDKEALLAWVQHRRKALYADAGMAPEFASEPVYAIPLQVVLHSGKVSLGNRLFHDTRLSVDNSVSCASCHALNKGGTDQAPVSIGIRGQKGGINSPTVYNAAHNFVQFWDGRAADLKAQAKGPVENPVEMGESWPNVVAKLKQDAGYVQAFRKHYLDGLTEDNVADAIAEFERSLSTPNARFDQYLRGNAKALNKDELAGYQLFKMHCVSCHAGVNLGGLSYEKMGRVHPYFTELAKLTDADLGRFNATKTETDRHFFKVPTLRNIALTGPYFHNAATSDLREAVKIMARHQVGARLNDQELDQITAFLKTLTGEYQGKLLQ